MAKWLDQPIPLGTEIKPYGKISAVGYVGERYYWLTSNDGRDIAMMPWFVIEPNETMPSEGKSAEPTK